MSIRDGKNKFYRQLNLSKELKLLLRMYNKVWKPQALRETKGIDNGTARET